MKLSHFDFLQAELPHLYKMAARAERTSASNPAAALSDLKHAGDWLTMDIMKREERNTEGHDPYDRLAELEQMELLKPAFITLLRRLMMMDLRESELFLEAGTVKQCLYGIYDLTCWYYTTYVDDRFAAEPMYVAPTAGKGVLANQDNAEPAPGLTTTIEIDGALRDMVWEESTGLTGDTGSRQDERGGSYSGETLHRLRHGKGTYVWADGTKYEGVWYRDLEHGRGTKLFANGDRYTGQWREGCFHGKGTYEWADGTVYEGEWDNHFEHGRGRITYPDGTVRNGFWSYGEFVHTTDRLHGTMVQPGSTGV
ncbi:hypothetical protein FE783_18005 [Paenibacillus mesophilus]|uniref:MORN repeat-containing protein n=1 Tax=Paenibacillus mesophilus TaxID=2582849 RepID=UPI00110DFC1A|nr:hypothetical protein [Paenibacillus mesophilus]TMV48408.1 hypothetical protein FE783_18005 [Paenibacillus mesophilus]